MAEEATTSLVALRARREQVIAQLSARFEEDVFGLEELEARLDRAHAAVSVAELDAIVADLSAAPAALAMRQPGTLVRDDPTRPERKRVWCILSGVDRRGRWTVPRRMSVFCCLGGGRIDFREADFGPGVSELHITAIMGGFEIFVPPELAVDMEASAIMGGFDERHRAPVSPDPARPVLRIRGIAVMGGVEVVTLLPGETRRQGRKRERKERKALAAAAAQKRLPGKPEGA